MPKNNFSSPRPVTINENIPNPTGHSGPTGHPEPELLFLQELRAIYGAEKHQELLLPLLRRAASSLPLQSVLAGHRYNTHGHIICLESLFRQLGQRVQARKTIAILGLARECEIVIGETEPGSATRDTGLILAARQLEHYEISAYGSLVQLARTLEYDDIADELGSILLEEKDNDDLLNALAENYILPDAGKE